MFLSFFSSLSFYFSIFLLSIYYISCFIFEKKFSSSKIQLSFFSKLKFSTDFYQIFNFFISILTILSFFGLILCFGTHDFNLYIVYANSQTKQNYIYTIGASWSSYEGSMLLWLVLMSIAGFLNSVVMNSKNIINQKTHHLIQHFSCGFQLVLYIYVLLNANPFKFTKSNVLEGLGFNPLLQDYALLTHPPILFFGYATTFVLFARILGFYFSRSTYELEKLPEIEKRFYRSLKNFILIPLFFLTVGIFLGAHWSYRELGWGGFWAWDPVENVSLLPWLCGISALHLIFEKDFFSRRKAFFFALNCSGMFILSLFATFVVRSGFVNSIHSFAQNSGRSFLLLVLIIASILIFFVACFVFFRNSAIQSKSNFSKKYFFLFSGSNLLSSLALIIISSVLIPIFYFSFFEKTINFSEGFFEISFGLILVPILFLLNLSYFFKDKFSKFFWKIAFFQAFTPFIGAFFLSYLLFKNELFFLAALNVCFAGLTFLNTIFQIYQNKQNYFFGFGKLLGHFSFSLLIFSTILSISFEKKEEAYLSQEKNQISVLDYRAELKNLKNKEDENIVSIYSEFEVFKGNSMIGSIFPELKFYKFEKMQIPDSASISVSLFSEIYLVTPRLDPGKKMILTQIYYKPYIKLVWLSGALMAISLIFGFIKGFFKFNRK